MKSKLFNLDLKDLLKGALIAALVIIATGLLTIIDSGNIADLIKWIFLKPILLAGVAGFLSYLIKNFLTNSDDKILKKELK